MVPPNVASGGFCTECGRPRQPDELVRFGERLICADCKEIYLQKLREGVGAAPAMAYAGFWIRFVASLLDGVILLIVRGIVQYSLAPASFIRHGAFLESTPLNVFMNLLIGAAYEGVFVNQWGATPGKMALGLKVVRSNGGPVDLLLAFVRYFAKIVSALTLMIGYIMAGFDSQKRALHDRICDTRVIRVRR